MKKGFYNILVLIILIFCIGCWDAHDIEEKNIVTVVIIDKTEHGYSFYIEIASLGKSGDNETSERGIIQKGEGVTFSDARKDLDRVSNNPVYLGANQAVIFTESMIFSDIEEYVYRIRQLPEYRKTIYLAATKEKPEDILNSETENENLVGFSIEKTIRYLVETGQALDLTLADILEMIASPLKCYLMPVIGLKDNMIALTGYAVMYGGKSKGIIPVEECDGLILLKAKKPKDTVVVMAQEQSFTLETELRKRKIRAFYDEGKITFDVNIEINSKIMYMEKRIDVNDKVIKQLSDKLEENLKTELISTILKSQKDFKSDYIGFGTAFRIKYPDLMKNLDWDQAFLEATFNINVKVNLRGSGNIDLNPKA